jgi:hypothetical protein
MDVTKNIAEFFLISLSLGVGAFSFLADTKKTGAGFLKVISGICGGSLVIASIIHLTAHPLSSITPSLIFYFCSIIPVVFVYFLHRDKKSLFMWFLYFFQNISHLFLLYFTMKSSLTGTIGFNNSQYLFLLSSTLLLGSITYSMVLGHWYLVVPKLSEKPLMIASYLIWVILALKIGWTTYSMLNEIEFFTQGTTLGFGYMFNWIMVSMRVGWGYLVIAVMSYFNWRLVKLRSIQSATGILYVMTIFVFIGELISSYLFYKYGLLI